MKYLDFDGDVHDSRVGAILSSARIGFNALRKGTFKDLMDTLKGEDHPELVTPQRYENAIVDWETGFVRMYNQRGVEVFSVKIDTDFYKRFSLQDD